ncbi:MAG: undecaprenyldiphospho-muramoylpentapeptide beta-N-acetylglucosaminyltransferase [Firmicutes bacterium]|nr:undecaprenyldiphospho-muramoylpentapeptide beta-N-acetylglucosaminyltransferase [Bacillota bacterium]
MKVMIAGGGTGGHVYPGITIAKTLLEREPDAHIMFVGTKRGLEADVVPKEGFNLVFIDVTGFRRKLSTETFLTIYRAVKSFFQATTIIKAFKPEVVVGTGGYVSGPVILAAWFLRIPTLIHEQNALPGYTTRILSRLACVVGLTYPESVKYFPQSIKTRLTGNPVRRSILETTRDKGSAAFGIDPKTTTILVFGGSQGARAINKVMVQVLPEVMGFKDIQVIYQTGKHDYSRVIKELKTTCGEALGTRNLTVKEYIYRMDYAMACADLVVSRAGAISIAEITGRGLPSILIPFPSSAEGHQEKNAEALESAGAAFMIREKDLSPESLIHAISGILKDKDQLRRMAAKSRALGRPDAADELADIIVSLAKGHARRP